MHLRCAAPPTPRWGCSELLRWRGGEPPDRERLCLVRQPLLSGQAGSAEGGSFGLDWKTRSFCCTFAVNSVDIWCFGCLHFFCCTFRWAMATFWFHRISHAFHTHIRIRVCVWLWSGTYESYTQQKNTRKVKKGETASKSMQSMCDFYF